MSTNTLDAPSNFNSIQSIDEKFHIFTDAPSIISQPSGRVEVEVGSIFEIVCEAKGIPQPIITWEYKDKPASDHLDNKRRLLVEVKNRHMVGPVQCIATNGVGEAAVAGIDMVVLCEFQSTYNAYK